MPSLQDLLGHHRLLLAFMSYLALGAYYNYSTYGATGFDLIPWVLLLSGSSFEMVLRPAPPQTPRLLERSTIHDSRCFESSLYLFPTEA